MKIKLALALTIASLLSAPSLAGNTLCPSVKELGRSVMTMRQGGMSRDYVKSLGNGQNSTTRDILNSMVKLAYAVPMEKSQQRKTKASNDFANQMYDFCVTTMEYENGK